MILTNNTARQVEFDLPAVFGGNHIAVPPAGGTATIPDDGYFVLRPMLLKLGLTVAQDGGAAGTSFSNNYVATTDPTITNDVSANYGPGSVWINTTTEAAFINRVNNVGAAVWTPTGTVGLKNNLAAIIAPTATDDSALGYAVGSVWIDVVTNTAYTAVDVSPTAAIWSNTNAAASPLASTFDIINVTATTLIGTPYTAATVQLGVTAVLFNGNSVVVLVNGFEQVKGSDVIWTSLTTFTLAIDLYAGDVITIKP